MNETFQLIKFILKWLGEESDIFLSSPKCQNVDDLFWATTATILVLPVLQLYLFICIYLGGGCLPFSHPVCRSGWFGIGKSSLLFIQPSLRMFWTVTSTAYFIQQTDTLFFFRLQLPHHNCSVYWCVFTCLGSMVKHPLAVKDTQVWSLNQKDPLEKKMVTNSSIFVWEISWTEQLGRLQSKGSQSQTWLNDSKTTNNKSL